MNQEDNIDIEDKQCYIENCSEKVTKCMTGADNVSLFMCDTHVQEFRDNVINQLILVADAIASDKIEMPK